VESGRFLPPELRAEIKQKVELTPQEKEILKKVVSEHVSVVVDVFCTQKKLLL
jgi:hypothetical protein